MVGYEPLDNAFGMEEETTLTMALPGDVDVHGWSISSGISVKSPDPTQLEQLELKCFGAVCGEDFVVRDNRRLREKILYLGAYLDGQLVGSCYVYVAGGYACVDSLMVDEDFRWRHVAATLLKHAVEDGGESGPFRIFTPMPKMFRKISMPGWDSASWIWRMSTRAPISLISSWIRAVPPGSRSSRRSLSAQCSSVVARG